VALGVPHLIVGLVQHELRLKYELLQRRIHLTRELQFSPHLRAVGLNRAGGGVGGDAEFGQPPAVVLDVFEVAFAVSLASELQVPTEVQSRQRLQAAAIRVAANYTWKSAFPSRLDQLRFGAGDPAERDQEPACGGVNIRCV
jgi:hypothetical protein